MLLKSVVLVKIALQILLGSLKMIFGLLDKLLNVLYKVNSSRPTTLMPNNCELARFNRASLYGLLNFYREYVPAFAKLVKPLRQLLGQDAHPWMPEARECIREVAAVMLSRRRAG